MPQPKKRHSNRRQGKRRFANYKLKGKGMARCPQCSAPKLPHQACLACGTYNGRSVLKIKAKKAKGEKA